MLNSAKFIRGMIFPHGRRKDLGSRSPRVNLVIPQRVGRLLRWLLVCLSRPTNTDLFVGSTTKQPHSLTCFSLIDGLSLTVRE